MATRYQADPHESRTMTRALIHGLFSREPAEVDLSRHLITHVITSTNDSFTDLDMRTLTRALMVDEDLERPIITTTGAAPAGRPLRPEDL